MWKQVRFHGAWSQLLIHFDTCLFLRSFVLVGYLVIVIVNSFVSSFVSYFLKFLLSSIKPLVVSLK